MTNLPTNPHKTQKLHQIKKIDQISELGGHWARGQQIIAPEKQIVRIGHLDRPKSTTISLLDTPVGRITFFLAYKKLLNK